MKTSHVFEIVAEDRCLHCGGERVGLDCDDLYQVVPGSNPRKESCTCPTCRHMDYRHEKYEQARKYRNGTALCPDCGHLMKQYDEHWPRPYICQERSRWVYDRVDGCPQCGETHQWVGMSAFSLGARW